MASVGLRSMVRAAQAQAEGPMELFEDTGPGENAPEYSVSEISGAVKRMVEGAFGHVRIRGELGRVSRPKSGHVYLDLKDDRAVLNAVIWKGSVRGLAVQPEEGMEVIATGRLTTFPGASRYQLIIESLAPAGMGALMVMLEKRRAALAAEGLFDAERKRPLPYLPETIGVITSPSGAVIRDILHRLRERFPRRVLLWPVAVQGEKCAAEVAAAIAGFNALPAGGTVPRPDVLIVARGGGSLEDLWGFNEEIVVRAAAASAIPLISAVGHETDTTLIDHVSDRRAPTPTAAAEMAVPVRRDLIATLAAFESRRQGALARALAQRQQRLRDVGRGLPRPEALLAERVQRLDGLGMRLPRALTALAREKRLRLGQGRAGQFGPGLLVALIARRRQGLHRGRCGAAPRGDAGAARAPGGPAGGARRAAGAGGATLTAPRRAALAGLARTLASLGPHSVMTRGYAIVRDGAGSVVTRRAIAAKAVALELEFADGRITARPEAPRSPTRGKRPPKGQGSLF